MLPVLVLLIRQIARIYLYGENYNPMDLVIVKVGGGSNCTLCPHGCSSPLHGTCIVGRMNQGLSDFS